MTLGCKDIEIKISVAKTQFLYSVVYYKSWRYILDFIPAFSNVRYSSTMDSLTNHLKKNVLVFQLHACALCSVEKYKVYILT